MLESGPVMQFDITADDGTDDAAEPVAPGTSCTCDPYSCYCYDLSPTYCPVQ